MVGANTAGVEPMSIKTASGHALEIGDRDHEVIERFIVGSGSLRR